MVVIPVAANPLAAPVGAEIVTVGVWLYPNPLLPMAIEVTVPAAETEQLQLPDWRWMLKDSVGTAVYPIPGVAPVPTAHGSVDQN